MIDPLTLQRSRHCRNTYILFSTHTHTHTRDLSQARAHEWPEFNSLQPSDLDPLVGIRRNGSIEVLRIDGGSGGHVLVVDDLLDSMDGSLGLLLALEH